jgi:16S rRNA (cytosine967-C5)-methyltransferase
LRREDARRVAARALADFERGRSPRIGPAIARAELDPRDRAFARELAYGVVRRRRLLDFVLGGRLAKGLPADAGARAALRLGCYQLLFTRVPPHAAVHESVALAGRSWRPLLNAVLRGVAGDVRPRHADPARPRAELSLPDGRACEVRTPFPDPVDEFESYRAIVDSLPVFLVRRWSERFGRATAADLTAASAEPPAIHLRTTAHAGSRDRLAARLAGEGVETAPAAHPLLTRWIGGSSPFESRAFADGWLVVQDPTSLRAAEALGARPGEVVVDYCAAPGTKSTVLAEAVGPHGRVFAYDPAPERRELILDNVRRLRLEANVVVVADPGELPRSADRVLVDAPCSNTGVLARRVEARERVSEDAIRGLARGQREILDHAVALARAGGTVVYSTCSIEREENEDVVAALVAVRPMAPELEETTLPLQGARDGGYFARLRWAGAGAGGGVGAP